MVTTSPAPATALWPCLASSKVASLLSPIKVPRSPPGAGGALGWVLAVLSGVLFTTNNFYVQYLTLDPGEMLLVRSGLQVVTLLVILVTTSGPAAFLPLGTSDRVLVMLQGLCSAARVFLQFSCLQHLPLGDALTLIFTEPLWTLLASRLLLGSRISAWKVAFSLVLLAGMFLCIQVLGLLRTLTHTMSSLPSCLDRERRLTTTTTTAQAPPSLSPQNQLVLSIMWG